MPYIAGIPDNVITGEELASRPRRNSTLTEDLKRAAAASAAVVADLARQERDRNRTAVPRPSLAPGTVITRASIAAMPGARRVSAATVAANAAAARAAGGYYYGPSATDPDSWLAHIAPPRRASARCVAESCSKALGALCFQLDAALPRCSGVTIVLVQLSMHCIIAVSQANAS